MRLRRAPPLSLSFRPRAPAAADLLPLPLLRSPAGRPRLAVLREEGSNGDREMAAAFFSAGFDVYDVTMSDLVEGRAAVDASFRGLAFPGGFSFADVLEELVGEVADEVAGTEDDLDLRLLSDVSAEVQASMRVSEVNERLALDLPEDGDYDTIGGFVLFELGHFPKRGEQLRHGRVRVTVVEANERRVLALRLDWDETLELVTENTP